MKSNANSRGSFVMKMALGSLAGTSLPIASSANGKIKSKFSAKPSDFDQTKLLTDLLGIKYPIIQASTGGW